MGEDFYYRHLPHYQPPDATFFITFRLKDSLPKEILQALLKERATLAKIIRLTKGKEERLKKVKEMRKRYFAEFDNFLDRASTGPRWLSNPEIADIVSEAFHFRDSKEYDLIAYCIMPNHVHSIFTPLPVGRRVSSPYIVTNILENLKWYTALKANRSLGRKGAFWQHESYDHVIRDNDELERMIQYVMENPVKARLVRRWSDWKWTYVKKNLLTEYEL